MSGVYLLPEGAGKTRVVVRMLGYGDDEESQATMNKLVERFENMNAKETNQ